MHAWFSRLPVGRFRSTNLKSCMRYGPTCKRVQLANLLPLERGLSARCSLGRHRGRPYSEVKDKLLKVVLESIPVFCLLFSSVFFLLSEFRIPNSELRIQNSVLCYLRRLALLITIGSTGTSRELPRLVVLTAEMVSTTFIPSITFPKAA